MHQSAKASIQVLPPLSPTPLTLCSGIAGPAPPSALFAPPSAPAVVNFCSASRAWRPERAFSVSPSCYVVG